MALRNIPKQNISDMVYAQFHKAIASGEWTPGHKIPSETELSAQLGVSRVSVRSALQKLTSLGLIESHQGEGTFVCEFSGAQYLNNLIPLLTLSKPNMQYFLEFRNILDKDMAAIAAQRADDALIQRLKANLAQHELLQNDLQAAAVCDLDFHCMIAEATLNPLLIQVYSIIREVFKSALYDIVAAMGTANALRYHRLIIDAIIQKDAAAAHQHMYEHIQDTIAASANISSDSYKNSK